MKIIILSIFIVFITMLFFLKTNNSKEKYMDNKELISLINTLFIDSPEDDLFLYDRLYLSIDERGIKSLGEYDFNLLKKNVEKVLKTYLKSVNLFPKSYFDDVSISSGNKDEWGNFIMGSLVYIEYLNSIGEQDKANEILEKIIYDTRQRVVYSKIMIDYITAMYNYNTLYRQIKSKKLFKKYPLPDKNIFFERLKSEKKYQFNRYKKSFNLALKEKYNKQTLKDNINKISKYKVQYLDTIKECLNYYDEFAIIIKSESSERIKLFEEEIEKEKKKSKKGATTSHLYYVRYQCLMIFPINYFYIYKRFTKITY